MALFDYRCHEGHKWTEKRDRDDKTLDVSAEQCAVCSGWGRRVRFFENDEAPAVYYHGRGWSRVDKNYGPG